ncbi:peptidoglycan D,D-transpeptidase FtsI family protein [Furfurilactobacillus entadae]|uniref:peptidoglycan D,D-transpeptidase FtsI family protein n=1 Tax=Furfurilactobacillus entadae TaxID=2922307 RepID=UPI0038B24D6A
MQRRRAQSNRDDQTTRIPIRLNILLVIVFVLLAVLGWRMAYLQIQNGAELKAEVNRTANTIETNSVQRGMIYDSTGKVLVGNEAHQAISYTKGINVTGADMFKVSNRLGKYLSVSSDALTSRQIAIYYLANEKNMAKVVAKIPKAAAMSDNALQTATQDYVVAHEPQLTAAQKNAAAIFTKMNGAYSLSTTYIKEKDVTATEVSQIGEHMSEMPGVKTSTSWSRDYPSGNSVKSFVGTVTTEKQGLPEDEVNQLLSQGYSRNDSVGSSYIEKAYEPILKGTKSRTSVEVSSNSTITKETQEYAGKKGSNLVLTINAKFQDAVQKVIDDQLPGGTCQGAYAVVMNPNTGAVLAMAGDSRNPTTGKVTTDALGAINQPIVMGSVVKPAMLTGGFESGALTPSNNTLNDQPIILTGTSKISTDWNQNGSYPMDAAMALETSSNSYAVQVAMKMVGYKYSQGASIEGLPTDMFQKLRNNFNQYGLGVKTGIDIPGESAGLKGLSTRKQIGSALVEAFGNYDAYTTLQLGQYVSTLANGGYRMKPYVVSQVRSTKNDGTLGAVDYQAEPTALNYVEASPEAKAIIKQGMWQVVNGSSPHKTGATVLEDLKPGIVAKTGTAETYVNGQQTVTSSIISYAPTKNPQVAVAVAVPGLPETTSSYLVNQNIAAEIYKLYWKNVTNSSEAS